MTAEKPRRLGRGLEALIGSSGTHQSTAPSELQRIPVARIKPNPFQPRHEFNPAELAELEASLKVNGLLQPITVRRMGDQYELIAGERRLRAATNLQWSEISAIVRDFDDRTLLVLALVENLQRADLNPVEEARGYQRLLEEFDLTHQQIAEAVGKDRTTVTNLLRLLTLPEAIIQAVNERVLSAGHARALLALDDENAMIDLADEIAQKGLSVRETEHRVRVWRNRKSVDHATEKDTMAADPESGPEAAQRDPSLARIEDDLRRYLQTDVHIQLSGSSKGHVRVAFYSSDDLERVLDLVLRENRRDF
jgi:ParB family transcriptional regulator, chromosome partitioning protein